VTITAQGQIEGSRYKSFSKNQLQEFQEVETWLKNIGLSSHNVYLSALRKLCSWYGKDPHELILQRDQELKSDDPIMRNGIRDMVLDFRHYLEDQGYAPKTINSMDGAVRSFFTAVLGRSGMVNLRNYKNAGVRREKDLVPTLEELKKMLDVVDLGEKFRILFISQTGMRVSDAVALRIGDVQRELNLGNVPLAIRFLPKKDRELIGERIAFLGSDGVLVLKEYLKWRVKRGEVLSDDSPLFVGRSKKRGKGRMPVTQQNFNETIRKAAKRIGLVNGDAKYGRMRVHCLRKFFITQMTNHGMEDKIINFLTCHKISDVDAVYWNRRVEGLRRIYAERQQYLNPINGKRKYYNLKEIKGIRGKIQDMDKRISSIEQIKELIKDVLQEEIIRLKQIVEHDSRIVSTEQEILEFSKLGYSCTSLGNNKWLMRN
jgi:integrase